MEDLISYAPCSGVAQIEGAHHSLSALMEYLRREPFTSVLWSFSLYFRRIPIIPQQQEFFRKGWGGPKEPPLTPSRPVCDPRLRAESLPLAGRSVVFQASALSPSTRRPV